MIKTKDNFIIFGDVELLKVVSEFSFGHPCHLYQNMGKNQVLSHCFDNQLLIMTIMMLIVDDDDTL